MYDSNCIHVEGRRLYKSLLATPRSSSSISTRMDWLGTFPSPTDEAAYARDGGMDVVPTRGARGALWLVSWRRGDNRPQLWECDLAKRQWFVLLQGGEFGAPSYNSALLSYNPRAFGGIGGRLSARVPARGPCVPTRLPSSRLHPLLSRFHCRTLDICAETRRDRAGSLPVPMDVCIPATVTPGPNVAGSPAFLLLVTTSDR